MPRQDSTMDRPELSTAPLYAAPMAWLAPALDEALAQIREALAAYRPGHPAPLDTAREHLHQLHGILTIAQWHGAALLCEEMEAAAAALAAGSGEADEIMTALAQGMTTLENYLRHIQAGHPDQPMALLPVLNELRAARQADLLSAGLLMRLEVAVASPPPAEQPTPADALPAVLRRLHGYYQSALLAWYKALDDQRALSQLQAVLDCLLESDCSEAHRRLWWVAGGAVEALAQGTLEAGLPLRRLLGQVERHLGTLARDPAGAPAPDDALVKDLLYYIAQAAPASPRVQTLHEAFQLAIAVPSPTYLSALSEAISTPERQAYAILAQGLLDDLRLLKTRIDFEARHPGAPAADLDDTRARLASLGDSLALLGLGRQRELLQQALKGLQDGHLEDLALALVHVEQALQRIARGDTQDPQAAETAPQDDHHDALQAALREARANLTQARNGILAYLATGSRERGLLDVPERLAELRGVLVLLGHERIARQVDALRRYIVYDLLEADEPPRQVALDLLADALVGLEHYLDAVERGVGALSPFVHAVARCLTVLGYPQDDLPAADIPVLDQPVSAAATVIPLPVDEVDEEVIAIFVEEAWEVTGDLTQTVAQLPEERLDAPLVDRLRHGFHTLKGSGRIAGAQALSDFAAALEAFLGRLASGAQTWTPAAAGLLRQAIERLPALVEAFAAQRPAPATTDILEAIERLPEAPEAGPAPTDATGEHTMADDEGITAPETAAPETAAPETAAPETVAPETVAPETVAPETVAPETATPEAATPAPLQALADRFSGLEGRDEALAAVEALAQYGRGQGLDHVVEFALRARTLLEDGVAEAPAWLAREVPPRLRPLAPPVAWEALGARLLSLSRPAPAAPAPEPASMPADIDPDLTAIFLEEAAELMEAIETALAACPAEDAVHALQRHLHTLKGGARMAGLMDMGETLHALESVAEAVAAGRLPWNDELRDTFRQTLDHIADGLDAVTAGRAPASGEAVRARLRERGTPARPTPTEAPAEPTPDTPAAPEAAAPAPAPREVTPPEAVEHLRSETLRIAADTLDELVNQAKEDGLLTIRASEQQGLLKSHLDELGKTIDRLRAQIRQLPAGVLLPGEGETDPGQALLETVEDLAGLHLAMHQINMENGRVLGQQTTVQRRLQSGLVEARMIPFARQLPRLERLVRKVARELGREARVELVGASGKLDRVTLERLAGPIEHLVRNALAHGIETPEEREAAGKPRVGRIRLGFAREGDEQIITVSDDGRGVDAGRVLARARERGLPVPDPVTPAALLDLLTHPGFSTAEAVNQVAGRGIGLDAVAAALRELGGRLELDTEPGRGTTFTLRIPFTLGMNRCVLVTVRDNVYALPAQHVDHVIQVGREELARLYQPGHGTVRHQGRVYRFANLARLLNLPHPLPARPAHLTPLVLVSHRDRHLALHVDRLLGSRELVLKGDTAPLASRREGVLGATVLGDGRVALVLDVPGLAARPLPEPEAAPEDVPPATAPEGPVKVLVVDDSITVRKVTERLLSRHHMRVRTARDGLEALEALEAERPDILLLDIEMPRMDGFELAERLRNSERWRDLPIIMISSRSGQRQRERASRLGVDRFLSKPYQEAVLVAQIEALTQRAHTPALD